MSYQQKIGASLSNRNERKMRYVIVKTASNLFLSQMIMVICNFHGSIERGTIAAQLSTSQLQKKTNVRRQYFSGRGLIMIRTSQATERADLVNSQPWSKGVVPASRWDGGDRPPVGKSRSVNQIFAKVSNVVNETKGMAASLHAPRLVSREQSNMTIKSDTDGTFPSKRSDSDCETGNESFSSERGVNPSKTRDTLLIQRYKPRNVSGISSNSFSHSILQNSFAEEDSDETIPSDKISMLGSIPRSFRISSSNFSTRSDITTPTIVEPPSGGGRLSPTARPSSDFSRGVRSIDCAPLKPRRRGSNDGEFISVVRKKSDIPCHIHCKLTDCCPTKPYRRSSITGIRTDSNSTESRQISFRTTHSTDLSPTKPCRQKSVSSLLSRDNDGRTSVSSITLRSNPQPSLKREKSMHSLSGSTTNSFFDSRKERLQTTTMHESILEEPGSDEYAEMPEKSTLV